MQGVSLTISAGSSVFVPGDWSFRILNTGTYRYTIIDVTELITCYYHLLMHMAYWVSMCDRNCIVIYTSKGNWPACFNGNMHHWSNVTIELVHCESKKNCATFIFTATLANVGGFLKFFQCRNQKEMAHNKNEKFPTVA